MDVHAESTEVEPHQIRPLNGHDLDLWHVVLHKQTDIRHVAFYVVQHLGEPVVAFPERGFERSVPKWRDAAHGSVDAPLHRCAHPGVGNDDETGGEAGKIERLRWCHAHDAVLLQLGTQRGKRDMVRTIQHQFAVYFVGDDDCIVGQGDLTDSHQLVP